MSEVAGRMSVQVGASYLEKERGGRGILLGGVPGVPPAHVAILGGGVVGTNAARIALGFGAKTTLIDVNLNRLRELEDIFGGRLYTLASNSYNIAQATREADLVIGGVLIPGATAPKLVTRAMVAQMKKGAVIVDVAIDQGGCVETARPTSHSNPSYVVDGVVHYCVTNMPGAVPHTSTLALTNSTFPYVAAHGEPGRARGAAAGCGPGRRTEHLDGRADLSRRGGKPATRLDSRGDRAWVKTIGGRRGSLAAYLTMVLQLGGTMERRQFLAASLATSAVALAGEASAQTTPARAREFYQLRRYSLMSGPQLKLTENYFSNALIPALARMGLGPVGAFRLDIGPETPAYYLLVPGPAVDTLATLDLQLAEDRNFLEAAAPFWNATAAAPAFERVEICAARSL